MLVGRDDEMQLLGVALETGRAGVVVAGPAGVGKTRLGIEFVESCDTNGRPTARVFATSTAARIPLGAFAPLLEGATDNGPNRAAGLRQAAATIAERAGDGRLLLFVDDAHLLDDTSAALVHHVALDPRVFIVATMRTGEVAPAAITALWKDGLAARVELQPLAGSDVAAMVADLVGGPIDAATARRLGDVTAGNALYLRELVTAGLENGALAPRSGVWMWTGPLVFGQRLNELIEMRITAVSDAERDVLEFIAVGEPLPLPMLLPLVSSEALELVERLGLIAIDGPSEEVRFAHPIHGEIMRDGIGRFRVRVVSGLLAQATAALPVIDNKDLMRRATWMLDGDAAHDPDLLNLATRAAINAWDHELAERFGQAAANAGSFQGLSDVAEALYWQNRYDEAVAIARRCDVDGVDPVVRVQARITQASSAMWGEGDAEKGESILADLIENDMFPEDWRAVALAQQASMRMMSGSPWEGVAMVEHLLDHEESRLRAGALQTCSTAWALGGQAVRGVDDTGWVLFEEELIAEAPNLVGGVLVGHCLAAWLAGRVPYLEAVTEAAYAMSAGRETDSFRGVFAFLRGRASLAAGRVSTAISQLTEAVAVLEEQDPGNVRSWALGSLAQALGQAGDGPAAIAASAASFKAMIPSIHVWESELLSGRAWAEAASGQLTKARATARAAAQMARSQGQWGSVAVHLHEIVRLDGAVDVGAELAAACAGHEGELAPAFAAHATAAAARDVDGLLAAAAAFEACGSLLLAAEAFADAAVAARGEGLKAKHAAAVAEAQRLADPAAATPLLRAIAEGSAVDLLSRREREVAVLAASGSTSAEIADALFLSIRTVDNHLARVYAKLGIAGRGELSSALLTT